MPKKILVTKDWHRDAMAAIEMVKRLDAINDKKTEAIRLAWMSYMETHLDEEMLEDFVEYCEKYKKELGLDF